MCHVHGPIHVHIHIITSTGKMYSIYTYMYTHVTDIVITRSPNRVDEGGCTNEQIRDEMKSQRKSS